MMKFGTPEAVEGPGKASTKPGFEAVGDPSRLRSGAPPPRRCPSAPFPGSTTTPDNSRPSPRPRSRCTRTPEPVRPCAEPPLGALASPGGANGARPPCSAPGPGAVPVDVVETPSEDGGSSCGGSAGGGAPLDGSPAGGGSSAGGGSAGWESDGGGSDGGGSDGGGSGGGCSSASASTDTGVPCRSERPLSCARVVPGGRSSTTDWSEPSASFMVTR
jgi:hypothetical protein